MPHAPRATRRIIAVATWKLSREAQKGAAYNKPALGPVGDTLDDFK
jgi:hypothetical protein